MLCLQRTFHGLNCAALVVLLYAIAGCGTDSSPSDTGGLDSTQPIDAISDNGHTDATGDNTIHDINPSDPGPDSITSDDGTDATDAESDEVIADVPGDEINNDTSDDSSFGTDTGPTDVLGTDLWVETAPAAILVELFSDDFEDSETASLENPWWLYLNSGVIEIVETDDYVPGSKVLRLVDTVQPGVSPAISRPLYELRDYLTDNTGSISFDFFGTGEAAAAYVQVAEMMIQFKRIGETGFFSVRLNSDSMSTLCTEQLPLDEWANISLRTDWQNSSADLFIDGVATNCLNVDMEAVSGTQFPFNFKISTINQSDSGGGPTYSGGTFMIDNIVIAETGETDVTRHGVTGQMWQKVPPAQKMSQTQGAAYCSKLLAPRGLEWRLPTIDELRSLVEVCSDTASGGGCGVTSECTNPTICRTPVCDGCEKTDTCYWFGKMAGSCIYPYLSSTLSSSITRDPWWLHYQNAYVGYMKRNGWVRCVLDYAE